MLSPVGGTESRRLILSGESRERGGGGGGRV